MTHAALALLLVGVVIWGAWPRRAPLTGLPSDRELLFLLLRKVSDMAPEITKILAQVDATVATLQAIKAELTTVAADRAAVSAAADKLAAATADVQALVPPQA